MTKKLYVGNLPYSVNDSVLADLFGQAGQIESAKVVIDKMSGRSKGFGFVEFANDDDATAAVDRFNGYELDGRSLKVSEARPQENNGREGRGGGGGGRPHFNKGGGRGGPPRQRF